MATKTKKRAKSNQNSRLFFGKMWKNTVRSKKSKHKGEKFFNLTADNKIDGKKVKEATLIINSQEFDLLSDEVQIQAWKNEKRDGIKDADYRLSIVSSDVEQEDEDDEDEDEDDDDDDD